LPLDACDTHAHVFGPFDRFPSAGPTSYLPPLAPYARYVGMLDTIGASRGVLVQPTFYGTTTDALLNALTEARRAGRWSLRGIAVATEAVSDVELHRMHAAGVRGLRFVEMPAPDGSGRYPGAVGIDHLVVLAPRLRALGWKAQLWCPIEVHALRLPDLVGLGVPLVVDHMGWFTPADGVSAPAFQQLLALLREGRIWIKLSLCRMSRQLPDYPDVRIFHDALIHANPARLLWGSDWPHVRMGDLAPDVGHLLDLFHAWTGDADLERRILVENPAALFDFEEPGDRAHA
jgi:predicted TIM-barrel fold metal-dependent hydrolase